jgi:hypothetical protein
MKNRKIEQKNTKQIVIDEGLHKDVKSKVARLGKSIKEHVEGLLNKDLYGR